MPERLSDQLHIRCQQIIDPVILPAEFKNPQFITTVQILAFIVVGLDDPIGDI